jgi:4a-hydroxytetrahydrobiopterin dehydratase
MEKDLKSKTCTACSGEEKPLTGNTLKEYSKEVDAGWKVEEEHHITRSFDFPDFRTALDFTNKVGSLAEEQGHHPDISLSWGNVTIKLFTHKIDGLHDNDFIMADKIDEIFKGYSNGGE